MALLDVNQEAHNIDLYVVCFKYSMPIKLIIEWSTIILPFGGNECSLLSVLNKCSLSVIVIDNGQHVYGLHVFPG